MGRGRLRGRSSIDCATSVLVPSRFGQEWQDDANYKLLEEKVFGRYADMEIGLKILFLAREVRVQVPPRAPQWFGAKA